MSSGIVDIAAAEPAGAVDNSHFDSIGLTDEWIRRRSGIATRTWLDEAVPLAELAAQACAPIVARLHDPTTVAALVLVSTSERQRIPSPAQRVAQLAGLPPSVMAFDMNAACCGFVYGLVNGLALCSGDPQRSVLVCAAETMSRMVDRTDRQTAFLFADGAAAVLLEDRPGFPAAGHVAGCDGSQESLMHETGTGIHLDGLEVYDRAVRRMSESARFLMDLTPAPSVVVGHQANGRILDQIRTYLAPYDVPYVNRIASFGNTSSASIPLAFAGALGDGELPSEGRLGAVSYGAGEAWGGVSVSYQVPQPTGRSPSIP